MKHIWILYYGLDMSLNNYGSMRDCFPIGFPIWKLAFDPNLGHCPKFEICNWPKFGAMPQILAIPDWWTCLPTTLITCKHAKLPNCLPICLPTISANQPVNLFPNLPSFLPVYCLLAYLPTRVGGWVKVETKTISVQQVGAGTELGNKLIIVDFWYCDGCRRCCRCWWWLSCDYTANLSYARARAELGIDKQYVTKKTRIFVTVYIFGVCIIPKVRSRLNIAKNIRIKCNFFLSLLTKLVNDFIRLQNWYQTQKHSSSVFLIAPVLDPNSFFDIYFSYQPFSPSY